MPVDRDVQVAGLGLRPPAEWPGDLRRGVAELRALCGNDADFRRHEAFGVLTDADLVRFLIARDGAVSKAAKMLRQALAWRSRRMPYWLLVDASSDVSVALQQEAQTGKIFAVDRDKYGRGLCCMDNTVENTVDIDAQMRFLAYNIGAARAHCAPGVDKICVVLNLEDFSLRNAVASSQVWETLEILTVVYPETLGTCVLWQPPAYFYAFFAVFRKVIDARTSTKLLFVSGDVTPGSENDIVMQESVGPNWRELTGLCLPRTQRSYSEYFHREILGARGFDFASYWPQVLASDAERAASAGAPPWPLQWHEAIDEEQWDGAYSGFWQASLSRCGDHTPRSLEMDKSDAGDQEEDAESEAWVTPPETDNEMSMPVMRPAPSVVGRPILKDIEQAEAQLEVRGLKAPRVPRMTPLCCLGWASFAINIILLFNTVLLIASPEWGKGPKRLMVAIRTLTLFDIPIVSIGVGLLGHMSPVPNGCDCVSSKCACVPWALFMLGCLSLPGAVGACISAAASNGDKFEIVIAPLLELFDAVLGISFATVWLRRLNVQKAAYAKM